MTKEHVISLIVIFFLLQAPLSSTAFAGEAKTIILLKDVPYSYHPPGEFLENLPPGSDTLKLSLDGSTLYAGTAKSILEEGILLTIESTGTHELEISSGTSTSTQNIRTLNGALSILPPVVAIVCALIFKQVVPALLAGVWLGSFFLTGFHPISSILRIVDHHVLQTLAGPEEGMDHVSIIVFTLLLGGMVGITSRMGGMKGIVNRLSRIATTARRGQLAVWLMGVIIFFDDYTNTLIVGNSARPLTDKLRISREKLSYIVDSTAAPITSLAVITSWIGFEISLINQSFVSMGIDRNPLATFVASLPYSFYPILAILFVLFIALSDRDYSSMLKAERRARITGKLMSDKALPLSNIDSRNIAAAEGVTPRLSNGVVPIAVVIAVTFAGLMITGKASLAGSVTGSTGLLDALKESNSFVALLWGSFAGCIAAALLAITQRLLSVTEIMTSWVNGIRSMIPAIIILVLAWCIGRVCAELHTADYLVHHLAGILSPRYLPLIVFLLAMGISFSTGTSWGTMSILIPIVIPLVFGTAKSTGISAGEMEPILLGTIAAILSGAVFGDHCSPISDTTIMSSMASAADHIDHVRTQLPYALTVGAVSLVSGYLLTALGAPLVVSLPLSCVILALVIALAGKSPENSSAPKT